MRPLPSTALVAAGAPALNINLDRSGPGSVPDYELFQRLDTLRFSRRLGYESWEPAAALDEHFASIGGKLSYRHEGWCALSGWEAADESWFVTTDVDRGWWDFTVAAQDQDTVDRMLAALEVLAGDPRRPASDEISMTVWAESPMGGGMPRYGSMKVGEWGDVSANYPEAVRGDLEALAANLPASSDGGIIVFGGRAGTGKTRAIESLCHRWASDARLGVVVDSERLLSSAAYLADVLTYCGHDKRQVIVVEDCDEMIAAGPKSAQTSKLLNVADGLVGRLAGAGTMFVLTANLPMDDIASYIRRPGRAAAVVDFTAFSPAEGVEWLAAHGIEQELKKEITLASLYGILRTHEAALAAEE